MNRRNAKRFIGGRTELQKLKQWVLRLEGELQEARVCAGDAERQLREIHTESVSPNRDDINGDLRRPAAPLTAEPDTGQPAADCDPGPLHVVEQLIAAVSAMTDVFLSADPIDRVKQVEPLRRVRDALAPLVGSRHASTVATLHVPFCFRGHTAQTPPSLPAVAHLPEIVFTLAEPPGFLDWLDNRADVALAEAGVPVKRIESLRKHTNELAQRWFKEMTPARITPSENH
jgi:hypothetical protein